MQGGLVGQTKILYLKEKELATFWQFQIIGEKKQLPQEISISAFSCSTFKTGWNQKLQVSLYVGRTTAMKNLLKSYFCPISKINVKVINIQEGCLLTKQQHIVLSTNQAKKYSNKFGVRPLFSQGVTNLSEISRVNYIFEQRKLNYTQIKS